MKCLTAPATHDSRSSESRRRRDWKHRQCARDAAMDALRVAVVKMRAHDAEREVLLDSLVNSSWRTSGGALLAGESRALRKNVPTDAPEIGNPARVPDARRQLKLGNDSSWSGATSRMNETSSGQAVVSHAPGPPRPTGCRGPYSPPLGSRGASATPFAASAAFHRMDSSCRDGIIVPG